MRIRIWWLFVPVALALGCAPAPEATAPVTHRASAPTASAVASAAPSAAPSSSCEDRPDSLRTAESVALVERELRVGVEPAAPTAIRATVARLCGSEPKIAFVDLIDQRFVSIVPEELNEELLRALLADDDLRVRVRAARAMPKTGLGATFEKELLAVLEAAAHDVGALHDVLQALGRARHEPFLGAIIPFLGHESPKIRTTAVVALCWGERDCGATVAPRLHDPDAGVRAETARALARQSARAQADEVAKLLDDEHAPVRVNAAMALGVIGDARHVASLRARLADTDQAVREVAKSAIDHIEKAGRAKNP